MAAIIDAEKCTGCSACVDVCPTEAIALNDDGIATMNEDLCGECGVCVEECPVEAISLP